MPAGIKKAYQSGSQAILNARIDKLTQQAATFTAQSWDNLVIYAATHPEDFARNTGQVAGYTSIALAAKRVSLPKVLGNIVQRKVLGKISANASARLITLANKVEKFSLKKQEMEATVKRVLTRGKAARKAADELETTGVVDDILDNGQGLTTKARVRTSPSRSAELSAGEKQEWDIINKTHCFPSGTLVLMADGSRKAIEQVQVGDEVMSRDEFTQQDSRQKVVRLFRSIAKSTLKLRFGGTETIEATPEHPFYVPGRGFVPAKLLKVGLLSLTLNQAVPVSAVETLSQSKPVYNFEVANTHTYFVGKSSLWVHNRCFKIGILKHLKYGEGLIDKQIKGAHNMAEFLKYKNDRVHGPLIQTVGRRRKIGDGLYVYEYRARRMLSGSTPGNLRPVPLTDPNPWVNRTLEKTVYDSSIHPDRRYLMWVYQAYQDAKVTNNFYGTGNRTWDGVAKNGLKFKGYLNDSGEVTTGFIP